MRLAALFLLAAPVFAGPITFTFEGTWDHVSPGVFPVELHEGDTVQGGFTFERFSAKLGDIEGDLDFALGSLVFRQQWFAEWEEQGFGVIGAYALTDELACRGFSGAASQCEAFIAFHERGRGNSLRINGAIARNLEVTPDIFPTPEPSTVILMGAALVILWRASRRKRLRPYHRL